MRAPDTLLCSTHKPTKYNVAYPPEIDLSKYNEPIGELYQLYNEWERVDSEIQHLLKTAINDQPMVDEFGDFSGLAELDLSQFDFPQSVPVPAPKLTPAAATPAQLPAVEAADSLPTLATVFQFLLQWMEVRLSFLPGLNREWAGHKRRRLKQLTC